MTKENQQAPFRLEMKAISKPEALHRIKRNVGYIDLWRNVSQKGCNNMSECAACLQMCYLLHSEGLSSLVGMCFLHGCSCSTGFTGVFQSL